MLIFPMQHRPDRGLVAWWRMSRRDIPACVQPAESEVCQQPQRPEQSSPRFRALGAGTSPREVLHRICWPEKPNCAITVGQVILTRTTGENRLFIVLGVTAMSTKLKDRLINAALILVFLGVVAGSAYGILKIMTRWPVKGLG
jgi:hypothetical protein